MHSPLSSTLSPFPISLQCSVYKPEEIPAFEVLLDTLHRCGFYGVEVNLPAMEQFDPAALRSLVQRHGLQLDQLATGAFAKAHGYSLSTNDPDIRRQSIQGCIQNLEFAARAGCGVILGFFKGGPGQARDSACLLLTDSLQQIRPYAERWGVPVLLEATNHRETSAACTLQETLDILAAVNSPSFGLLADTYHMNLEETSVYDALQHYAGWFERLHLSDDNRFFPGFGGLDFKRIFSLLSQNGYSGRLGIEGNCLHSLAQDLLSSADYLARCTPSAQNVFQGSRD